MEFSVMPTCWDPSFTNLVNQYFKQLKKWKKNASAEQLTMNKHHLAKKIIKINNNSKNKFVHTCKSAGYWHTAQCKISAGKPWQFPWQPESSRM